METPDPPAEGGQAQDQQPTAAPARRGRSRTSPAQRIVQAALTLLLLFLIFGVVLPQIADWGDVWDAITSITVGAALLLVALFVLIEVLKGAEQAVAIEPLSVPKAVVASEASTAVSNVLPGPSGTAMRLYIYRTWGLTSADFAKGWLLTSIVNNAIILFMPSIALAVYAAQGDVSGKLVALAVIGAVLSLVCIGIAAGALRSEHFAARVGAVCARFVTGRAGSRTGPRTPTWPPSSCAFARRRSTPCGRPACVCCS